MNPHDPLTPEERALARLLGRPAEVRPPAALDDAVMAAARAAVQAPPTPAEPAVEPATDALGGTATPAARRRPRSRLPGVFGLAASVVFAVGIAWQLKPEPPSAPAPAESMAMESVAAPVAPPPEDTAAAPAPQAARAAQADAAPAAAPPPPPAPLRRVAPAPVAEAPASAPVLKPAPAPVAPAPQAPWVDIPEARPADIVSPPSPPQEAAPAAAAADALSAAPASTPRSAPGVTRRAMAPMAAPAAPAAALEPQHSAARALALAVEADAALPRKRWLTRIRERRDAGDLNTARASLERYLAQYPEVRIPRDLRQLLEN